MLNWSDTSYDGFERQVPPKDPKFLLLTTLELVLEFILPLLAITPVIVVFEEEKDDLG